MKIFHFNDKITFWKYSWRVISDIIKENPEYIDWCFHNIRDMVITNNVEIMNIDNELITWANNVPWKWRIIDIINDYTEQIKEFKKDIQSIFLFLPCLFDNKTSRYYNCQLQEVYGNFSEYMEFIPLPGLIKDDLPIDKLEVVFNDRKISWNTRDLKISSLYFKKITFIGWWEIDVDNYSETIAIFTNIYNQKNVVSINQILNMNSWGDYLYKYSKRVWWSREDWDFVHWYETSNTPRT